MSSEPLAYFSDMDSLSLVQMISPSITPLNSCLKEGSAPPLNQTLPSACALTSSPLYGCNLVLDLIWFPLSCLESVQPPSILPYQLINPAHSVSHLQGLPLFLERTGYSCCLPFISPSAGHPLFISVLSRVTCIY